MNEDRSPTTSFDGGETSSSYKQGITRLLGVGVDLVYNYSLSLGLHATRINILNFKWLFMLAI